MATLPIWQDHYVTLGSSAYHDYELRLETTSGPIIYTGRAYKRPGATDVVVRINDIVADYLREQLPQMAAAGFTSFALAAHVLTRVGGTTKDNNTFYNNWSYDPSFTTSMALSDPVKKEVDPRQHVLYSTLPAASVTATLYYKDGTTGTVVIPIAGSADFNNDFNEDFSTIDGTKVGGCAVLDLSAFTGLDRVKIGKVTYKVVEKCPEWAVYYVNAYGGWDHLLVEGNVSRREAVARKTSKQDYDNSLPAARGTRNYLAEITPTWTLNTGILSDDESSRMPHLLNSVEVYLCELGTGRMHPVVLTDTEHALQTFKSNGRRVNEYTFTAQLAQERIRR